MPKISNKYSPATELRCLRSLRNLYEACDVDVSITLADYIEKHTKIDGNPFSFKGYEYLIEPVNDLHPRQCMIKPSQVGATEALARKNIAFLMKYALTPFYYYEDGEETQKQGINGIYSLPNDSDVKKFAKDRILSKIVNPAEKIKNASLESTSESLDLLGFHNSFLYLLGRGSEAAVQSIPAEIVLVDEFDQGKVLVNRDMLYARLRNAHVIGNKYFKGLFIGYGTPTLPDDTGELIDGQFNMSDQKEFNVKCTHCNSWQIIVWPNSCANYFEKGVDKKDRPKKDAYWQCLKCSKPLDFTVIGRRYSDNPNKLQNAEWVAKYPDRTEDGGGLRGYRIPFASGRNTALNILSQRDIDYNRKKDFYNFSLGYSYRDASMGLNNKDFLRYVNKDLTVGYQPGVHVMGIDQGCYIVIARQKPHTSTKMKPMGIWQVVWMEYCPDIDAFSKVQRKDGELVITEGKISKLIKEFEVYSVVADRLPNTASADALGLEYGNIIWKNISSGTSKNRLVITDDKDDPDGLQGRTIIENRHMAIDKYFDEIKAGIYEYPRDGDEIFKLFIDHHCALLKDDSIQKTKDGKSKGDINYSYYTIGGKPDHWGQAGKFLSEAIELLDKVNPESTRIMTPHIESVQMAMN